MNSSEAYKNERVQYSAILTAQAWPIKDLSYGQPKSLLERQIKVGKTGPPLHGRVEDRARFDSSCTLVEPAK